MSERIRTRLDRARRIVHDYPATTAMVAITAFIAIIAIAVPDTVAIWILLALAGGLIGFGILCLSHLETVGRRDRRRPE